MEQILPNVIWEDPKTVWEHPKSIWEDPRGVSEDPPRVSEDPPRVWEDPLMRAWMLLSICLCLIPLPSQAAAIHDAAKKGDAAAITAALDAGADVNEPDGFATPLYYAVSRQHLDAAKLLIDRGADVNVGSKISGPPLKARLA